MKQLFKLLDTKENKVLDESYPDKMAAKTIRKTLNTQDSTGKEILRYKVTYGPDHRRYKHHG